MLTCPRCKSIYVTERYEITGRYVVAVESPGFDISGKAVCQKCGHSSLVFELKKVFYPLTLLDLSEESKEKIETEKKIDGLIDIIKHVKSDFLSNNQ